MNNSEVYINIINTHQRSKQKTYFYLNISKNIPKISTIPKKNNIIILKKNQIQIKSINDPSNNEYYRMTIHFQHYKNMNIHPHLRYFHHHISKKIQLFHFHIQGRFGNRKRLYYLCIYNRDLLYNAMSSLVCFYCRIISRIRLCRFRKDCILMGIRG